MSELYGQTEKALSKGADFVDQARGDRGPLTHWCSPWMCFLHPPEGQGH